MNKDLSKKLIEQLEIASPNKVVFWGASLFLKEFLENNSVEKYNIIGIVDNNKQKWGTKLQDIMIIPPLKLLTPEPVFVIFTIFNNSEKFYIDAVKKIDMLNSHKICLLTNIFKQEEIRPDKSNKIYIIKEKGEKEEVEYIEGVKINFTGKNAKIEIDEYQINTFENCKINCGDNCHITIKSTNFRIRNLTLDLLADNANLFIDRDFSIMHGYISILDEPNLKISIGKDCMFSGNIYIRSSDGHTVYDNQTGEILNTPEINSIEIGDHVWLCGNVCILKNSKIGNNSIVAINSIINNKFDDENVVLAGSPAKITKRNINWDRLKTHQYKQRILDAKN